MVSDETSVPASRDFDADVRVLAEVRRYVCQTVGIELDHPAVLVASELAANAIRHAGSPFTLSVAMIPALRIEVSDRSPAPPVVLPVDGYPGGLGLRVVDALSSRWGVDETAAGKLVWAEVPAVERD